MCHCWGRAPPGLGSTHLGAVLSAPGGMAVLEEGSYLTALENHGSSGETYVHLDTTPVSHDRHSHFQMTLCSQVGPLKWGHLFAKSQGLEGIVAWLGKFQHHPESQETSWLSGALGDGRSSLSPSEVSGAIGPFRFHEAPGTAKLLFISSSASLVTLNLILWPLKSCHLHLSRTDKAFLEHF